MRIHRILPVVVGAAFATVIGATSVVGGATPPDLVAVARADADRGGSVQVDTTQAPPPALTPEPADEGIEVVERTNAVRARHGLAPVTIEPRLVQAALAHSADQAANNRMSHTGSNGSTMVHRIDATGYSWSRVAENVAAGQRSAASVTDAWLGSPGHRANMLDARIVHIGVAVVHASNGTPYWTMVLAAPR